MSFRRPITATVLAGLVAPLVVSVAVGQEADRVLINEIQGGGGTEWVELHNWSANPVDLEDYRLEVRSARSDRADRFSFPDEEIGPGEFFVLCLVETPPPDCAPPCGRCVEGVLDRDGGTVQLIFTDCGETADNRVLDDLPYPPLPKGPPRSFGIAPGGPRCVLETPTPGAPNSACLSNERRLVINEISTTGTANTPCPPGSPLTECRDWIEIYLPGEAPVDLQSYVLENGDAEVHLPPNTLTADQRFFLAVRMSPEDLFRQPPPPWHSVPFGFQREGDSVVLRSLDGSSFDRVVVPRLEDGVSWSRVPDGERFVATRQTTPFGPNEAAGEGLPPRISILERQPLLVRPGDPITVIARVTDADGDLLSGSVGLVWRPGPIDPEACSCAESPHCCPVDLPARPLDGCEDLADDAGRQAVLCSMGPGKLEGCPNQEGPEIFAGTIAGLPSEGVLTFYVVAADSSGNSTESERFAVRVQPPLWTNPIPENPTHVLRINEVAAQGGITDFVEIHNPSDQPVLLTGMILTDDILTTAGRELPPGTHIPKESFATIRLDGQTIPDPSEPHLPFRLDGCRDEVILLHSDGSTVVDFIEVKESKRNRSFGRLPDGGDRLFLMEPTLGEPNRLSACIEFVTAEDAPVVINELLADNKTVGADGGGEFGDYLELYNRSGSDLGLEGWELRDLGIRELGRADAPNEPTVWRFPPGSCIAAGERLLIWCDNDECETDRCNGGEAEPCCLADGEIHTNFEINRWREIVQLVTPGGEVADCVSIAFQGRDLAVGRVPDGADTTHFIVPSPGSPNELHPADGELKTVSCIAADPDFLGRDTSCWQPIFQRGDSTDDCAVDLSDGVFVLSWLFRGAEMPRCPDAADADDDGRINLTDVVFLLRWLFADGEKPPAPGPISPGEDPTEDRLGRCRPNPGCPLR